MRLRKSLKILHTISSAGLTGGLLCYMILLVLAPQDTPAAYADLRESIAAISTWLLLPSLAIALITGLLSMAFHHPFQEKRWVWLKAAMGILMFKGVLTIIGAKADHGAAIARRIANGEDQTALLQEALHFEWAMLWIILALTIANIVLGVWRPSLKRQPQRASRHAAQGNPAAAGEPVRPAE